MPAATLATADLRGRWFRLHRRIRRVVLRRRRAWAALLAGAAAVSGLRVAAPPPEPTVDVIIATRHLPAGTRLSAEDVSTARFRPETVPAGLVGAPVGRLLAGPLNRGEPVTDTRLVGPALTGGRPDLVAAPVRLPDAAAADLLRVGEMIDVLAADPRGGETVVVARSALVLAVPEPPAQDSLPGRLIVLGLHASEVSEVARASVTHFLSVSFR